MQAAFESASKTGEPLVSVMISTFNYGQFLPASVGSVLSQTYKNWELIVVDDGSTDNTASVMASFSRTPRITYVPRPHEGHVKAKNLGISMAKGEFVALLDADDVWDKEKLKKQIALFKEPAVGVVYCRLKFIGEDGQETGKEPDSKYLAPCRGRVTRRLYIDNFVPFSAAVVRKECFKKVGLLDESYTIGNDWDLWLRMSAHYDFDFVDEPLLLYRTGHGGQLSQKINLRHKCAEEIMRNFAKNFPRALSDADRRRAWAYTYTNRAFYFRSIDLKKSTYFYFKAIKEGFWRLSPFIGLMKNLVFWLRS